MQEIGKGVAALLIVIMLAVVGASIALAKMLVSGEQITARLAVGRAILGGATSTVAGLVLMRFPDMPLPALVGAGSVVGILGAQWLEAWLKKQANKFGS
ncbi:phage holin family protein [Chromobacterium vaccinii]|uniref:Holin n=1 Tax=Chromobacterium vaccinii TaxID=1108595 RepID=A0A1D9LNI4_9NEIS|nr:MULTISPECIES: holin [Chromobacterium]AOZ52734.1 holin [Chromobacterium vaccinii]MCD4483381.1 phage holin family protein [Chromobacterium vaccinii]MCD4504744.1 phage holin family protein [Chromobacterium piscinae]NHQ84209.1 holin [Chromobacterium vaccinii]